MAAKKVTVVVSRNGAVIQADGVAIEDAAETMADLLEMFRLVARAYPELIVDLPSLPGSTCATNVPEYFDEECRKRVGF